MCLSFLSFHGCQQWKDNMEYSLQRNRKNLQPRSGYKMYSNHVSWLHTASCSGCFKWYANYSTGCGILPRILLLTLRRILATSASMLLWSWSEVCLTVYILSGKWVIKLKDFLKWMERSTAKILKVKWSFISTKVYWYDDTAYGLYLQFICANGYKCTVVNKTKYLIMFSMIN